MWLGRSLPLALILLLVGAAPLRAEPPPPPQWIVVTPAAFRSAIEPLAEHRKAQGMQVKVVQTTDILSNREILTGDAAKLRAHVNGLCRQAKGASYVLLVGAVEPGLLPQPETRVLPPLKGTVSRMKGQPSDNGYGCLGADLLPTVPVGRLPARTLEEARQMVQKTLAFERDAEPGEWRRQLTVLAGVPAFNPFVDKVVETLALARFERLDPSWSGRAIYHNPQSRFCLPDELLHDRALAYVQAGQLLTLYLGHSGPEAFYAGRARYLDRNDWARLKIPRGAGVFASFGCNGCQLSAPQGEGFGTVDIRQLSGRDGEGYGVAAIRNPNGPVAVLGSHGICFAAMVQLAADGLMESVAAGPPERLGTAWLRIKEGLAKGKIDDFTFSMLDAVDGDSKIPQATQRLEHLEMFVLLGDPALRLPVLPVDVGLQVTGNVVPGNTITVAGKVSPRLAGARAKLTLERPLTSFAADLQPLPSAAGEERARVMLANHERSNRFVLAVQEATVRDGRFEVQVKLPDKVPWPKLVLRAYAVNEARQEGLGVLTLPMKP